MSLITAHRVLIAAAIALFVFYGAFELRGFLDGGGAGALIRALVSAGAAVGWAFYLRTVKPRKAASAKRPRERDA